MAFNVLFILFILTYILLVCSYWCISKHLGAAGLYTLSVFLTAAAYLYIIHSYLFESEFLFYVLLSILFLTLILLAVYIDSMLLIGRRMQLAFSVFMCIMDILLVVYALLLTQWAVISAGLFSQVCAAAGLCCGFFAGYIFETALIHFNTRCFYLAEQILKLLTGMSVSGIIIYMLLLSGNIPLLQALFSFLCSFWITGLYPVLILRIQKYEYGHH